MAKKLTVQIVVDPEENLRILRKIEQAVRAGEPGEDE